MVTQVDAISTPPTPADPPAVFEERAAQVWSDLARAVPQMNAQVLENNAAADEADQAKNRAITEADLAMGYRNAAQAAALQSSGFASDANAAKQAAEQAQEASVEAKDDAERARDQAQGYADGMGQFIAMAATFTEVPLEFQAWMIAVTQPHLRIMVWDSAQGKYIRAPWHAPGQLSYFLRSVPAGYVEVRSDVVLNRADFPDLAEYLGVTAATFTLDETRGEFLRALDSGRGVDASRTAGSWQDSDNKSHTHTGSTGSAGAHTHTVSGSTANAGGHYHGFGYHNNNNHGAFLFKSGMPQGQLVSGTQGAIWNGSGGGANSGGTTTYNLATSKPLDLSEGGHTHSVSGTAASAGAHTHSVTVAASGGTESRPRNRAYRLAVQY